MFMGEGLVLAFTSPSIFNLHSMRRLKIKLVLISLLVILIIFIKMKNIKDYILYFVIGLAGIAIGVFGNKMFHKCPEPIVEKIVEECHTYIDTCLTQSVIIEDTIIADNNIQIKKGKTVIDEVVPHITEVKEESPKKFVTKFNKEIKGEFTTFKAEFEVESESPASIKSWRLQYSEDTVLMKQVYQRTITKEILLEPAHKEIIKYLPTEAKYIRYGIEGSVVYQDNFSYEPGAYIEWRNGLQAGTSVNINNKELNNVRVNLRIPLFKKK